MGITNHLAASAPDQDRDRLCSGLIPVPSASVAYIESIATGNPPEIIDQADTAASVAGLAPTPRDAERIRRVFDKTRVTRRHLAVDPLAPEFVDYSTRPATIGERMQMFYDHAVPLAVEVAGRALGDTDPASIGTLIFVTSTGFIAPGVDVAVVRELGLSPSVGRLTVNFMGCAAAMNAIRTASDYVRAQPDRKALVVCIEISSVNAAFSGDQQAVASELITHSLFGDGCGALVIGASSPQQPLQAGQIVVRRAFSRLFDDAADGIVLGINHNGVTCDLSPELGDYILAGVGTVVEGVLADAGLTTDQVDEWAIHPGGPKIIEQSIASLGLDPSVAQTSWDMLAEYGNMLSVSLVFVLEQIAARRAVAEGITTGIAFSFAPGVTLEGLLFDVVGRESADAESRCGDQPCA